MKNPQYRYNGESAPMHPQSFSLLVIWNYISEKKVNWIILHLPDTSALIASGVSVPFWQNIASMMWTEASWCRDWFIYLVTLTLNTKNKQIIDPASLCHVLRVDFIIHCNITKSAKLKTMVRTFWRSLDLETALGEIYCTQPRGEWEIPSHNSEKISHILKRLL